jgi:hypothetical protein
LPETAQLLVGDDLRTITELSRTIPETCQRKAPTPKAAGFLQKPFTLATLMEKVEGALKGGVVDDAAPAVG